MQAYLIQTKIKKSAITIKLFSFRKKVERLGLQIIAIVLLVVMVSCDSKPKEVEVVIPYFKINGTEFNSEFNGIPDTLDGRVYQANIDVPVRFEGPPSVLPSENQWYIDGKLVEKGKAAFHHQFEYPGLYQIKHCHGTVECAIRYVFVPHPVPIIEESEVKEEKPQTPEPIEYSPPKHEGKTKKSPPVTKPADTDIPTTPKEPVVVEPKPIGKPPESFKNSATTGLSSGSYKVECSKWVESASIILKPKEFCLLNTGVIYGNGPGKMRITLSDGQGYNESMSILLTKGRTQFSFSDLIPVLYPGRVYTIAIGAIPGVNGEKPKIGNISTCNVTPKSTSSLVVDYGSNSVLFDINYKLK